MHDHLVPNTIVPIDYSFFRVSVDINMTSLRVKYKLEIYESEENREDSRKKPIEGLHKFSELGRKFGFNFFVNVKYESKTQKWTSEGREISMNRSSSQGNAFIWSYFYMLSA